MKQRQRKEIVELSTGQMVTINEIFKDDPEMLKELAELKKRWQENPHHFDFPEEKHTQGQKK